ncbi:hypothetical protein GCM10009696_35660 [Kocuria himachalensis]
MDLWSFIGAAAATGLGGFDPGPALIGAAALGSGIPHRQVLGFGALLISGTAVCGIAMTALVGSRLSRVDWHALLRDGATAAWIEVAVGTGLLVYATHRLVRRHHRARTSTRRPPNATGLYLTALGFVAIVVFDVPFEIFVTAAGDQPHWLVGAGWTLWALISQLPLTLLLLAIMAKRHTAMVRIVTAAQKRLGPLAHLLLGTALGLVGLFLTVDAVRFLAIGRFIID